MPNVKATLNLGVAFNKAQFNAELANVMASVQKQPPIQFKTSFGGVDVGNAQSVLSGIQEQATAIENVIVKQRTLKNVAGDTLNGLTQMTVRWRDANGNVLESIKQIESNVSKIPKGFHVEEQVSANMKVGESVRATNKLYEQRLREFDNMEKRAVDWSTRAESMGKKEGDAIKQTSALLRNKIDSYRSLIATGTTAGRAQAETEIRGLNNELEKNISASKRAASGVRSFADNISNAIRQTVAYTFSLGALRAAQQLVAEGMRYVIDLNKELVKIQVLQVQGAQTPEEINALAGEYNTLAKELGATTLEVTKGSVEWLRQGKTIEETKELLRSSTMLSKLGNLDAAESTEYLTSTLNSYKMSAEEASSVVDKLIAVDNKAATSSGELATALRYSAASAADAGVTLDQLISYIGVVSSTTRQNAESIGQAFKTIFARMQDIKAGKIDEDGLGINNVESALARVDIRLRDSKDSFRDMSGVLEELAGKWDTLNEIEQENIAKAIAGVRQQNLFRVLMANMGQALDLQKEEFNSTGLAADRYEIYLQGVEAAQNKLKASMEALWQGGISSGLITGFLNGASAALEFLDAIGGLKTVLIAFLAVMVVVNASSMYLWATQSAGAIGLLVEALWTGTGAATAFGLAVNTLGTAGIGLLITAVVVLIGYLYTLTKQAENNRKAFDELSASAEKSANAYAKLKSARDDVEELWKEMERLRAITNRTTEESKKLVDIQNQLNTLAPGMIVGSYDDELNFIIDVNANMETTLALLQQELDLKKEIALQDEKAAVIAGEKVAEDLANQKEKLKTQLQALDANIERISTSGTEGERSQLPGIIEMRDEKQKQLKEIELQENQHVQKVLDVYKKLTTDLEKELFIRTIDNQEALDAIAKYEEEIADTVKTDAENNPIVVPVKVELDRENFAETIERVREQIEQVQDIIRRANLGEIISAADLAVLDEAGIKYQQTADGISVAAEEFYRYRDAQLEAVKSTNDLSDAQTAVVDDIIDGFGYFSQTQDAYKQTYNDLSDAIWSYAENAGVAFYDMQGNAITSANGIFSALSQSSASFQNIVSQMAQATGKTTLEVMMMIANYATQVTQGMLGLVPTPQKLSFDAPKAGGGGGGESPEEARLKREIKKLEDKKKALNDAADKFKRLIDLQKEALRLQKEEAEFQDMLAEKNKNLADLKTEIATLALDDSMEARARRLQLEEEAAQLETEIEQDKADRQYEVQIDALDRAQKEFEAKIDAQIDKIEKTIDKYQEQAKAIKSSGGAVGGVTQATQQLGIMTQEVGKQMVEAFSTQLQLTEKSKQALQEETNQWVKKGATIEDAYASLWEYAMLLSEINNAMKTMNPHEFQAEYGLTKQEAKEQYGSYHTGGFVGDLKANEEFARLLDGEYVATEAQMQNFMRNVIPKMAETQVNKNEGNSVSVSMPITVQGNMDASVVPDLEAMMNKVVEKINNALYTRGITRNTNLTRI